MNEIIYKFNNSSPNKELTNSLTQKNILSISSDFSVPELKNILSKNPYLVNTEDENKETFMSYAIKRNNTDIINLLLTSPIINLSYQNEFTGNTYLHLAVIQQNIKLIKTLLDKGIFIDIQNNEGNTALHLAYYVNNIDIIKLLIENDIDFSIKNKKGLIPEEIEPIENINDIAGYEVNDISKKNLGDLNLSNSGETKYKSSLKTKNENLLKEKNKKINSINLNYNLNDSSDKKNDINIQNFDIRLSNIINENDFDNVQTIQNEFFQENEPEKEQEKNLIGLSQELNLSTIKVNNNNIYKKEKMIQCENKSLYEFLAQINMQKYYNIFNNNGFEDVNIIIEDTKLGNNLTDMQLKMIGISNPGDRAKILIRFEEKSNLFNFVVPKSVYYTLNNFDKYDKDININNLNIWLKTIKLEQYLIKFIDNGYYSHELLLVQTLSKNPLSDAILKDELGIEKLGHRARILNKLNEESKHYVNYLRESIITYHEEENSKNCSDCFII